MALLLISLLFLTLAFFLLKNNLRKSGLSPSPAKLPIIGNLHQLGTLPHHSLHALSLKHGPLMRLHLGAIPHYVVSSAEMKINDAAFFDMPFSIISNRPFYGGKDVAFAHYGDYWRQEHPRLRLQAYGETPREGTLQAREAVQTGASEAETSGIRGDTQGGHPTGP